MLKKFIAVAVIAAATLCGSGSEANAQAAPIAYDYLTQGFDYATVAFTDFGTADGYDAYIYAYDAQYFVSAGDYYDAYIFGSYAADSALADYYATGDGNAYEAYYLLSVGALQAYYADIGY